MGDIVNLRRVRKAKARADARAGAAANRLGHGRTRAEKLTAEAEKLRTAKLLDGARLDRGLGKPKPRR